MNWSILGEFLPLMLLAKPCFHDLATSSLKEGHWFTPYVLPELLSVENIMFINLSLGEVIIDGTNCSNYFFFVLPNSSIGFIYCVQGFSHYANWVNIYRCIIDAKSMKIYGKKHPLSFTLIYLHVFLDSHYLFFKSNH